MRVTTPGGGAPFRPPPRPARTPAEKLGGELNSSVVSRLIKGSPEHAGRKIGGRIEFFIGKPAYYLNGQFSSPALSSRHTTN
eukprot:3080985-Pyramimonas_sp.AAC.2